MLVSKSVRLALLSSVALATMAAMQPVSPDSEERLSGAFGAYLVARSAVQSRDMSVAATQFERAIRDDPGVPELNNQAFIAALMSGQARAADLAAAAPGSPLAQYVLADRDAKAGRWAAAEARYAAIPQDQPLTQVLRPLLIAWSQQGQGHTAAALATLAPMVQGTRFRGVYALHSALIADQAGRADDAARFYQIAIADFGPPNLRLAVTIASWQARHGQMEAAHRTIADLAVADGDLSMTQAGLDADIATPAVATAADGVAEAYLALAATLRQQGSETAQAMVQLALDMRPNFTAARIVLADIEAGAKEPAAALATLNKISPTDPLTPLISLRRAALLDDAGQTAPATALLEKLARDYPARPEPLAQLGDLLRRKDQFAEAAKAYSAAIDRVGTPSRANWPIFYARGISYERAGDWAKAEPDLKYALELAPDQPSVLNYLAYSWAERGEHLDEAKQMLARALVSRPNEGAYVDSLGYVLLRQGDTAGALQQLQHAVELEPEDAVINGHLGDALAAAGRMREAEFQWRRALNLKPDPDDEKKLNEKLAALPAPSTAGDTVPR